VKLLFFSDIHADWRRLEQLMAIEADYYVCLGDLVNHARGLERAAELMLPRASQVLLMPGNHEHERDTAQLCATHGFTHLHQRTLALPHGFTLAGLGHSNLTPFNTPGESSEPELAARLAPFAAHRPLILACHCPPHRTPLDRAAEGLHFGSSAVAAFLEATQPAWFFCGHIHEAAGVETTIGQTPARNVGKAGFLLDLDKMVAS
jgi:uncharacterized protein